MDAGEGVLYICILGYNDLDFFTKWSLPEIDVKWDPALFDTRSASIVDFYP